MASMRELKRRIASVQSSQKITGAMKMIASSRFRKEEIHAKQSISYEQQLLSTWSHMWRENNDYRPLLAIPRPPQCVTLVVIASDEGLCGSFNSSLLRKLTERIAAYPDIPVEIYPLGKKLLTEIYRLSAVTVRETPSLWEQKEYHETLISLADILADDFLSRKTDQVEIIYTHFKSIGVHEVTYFQLLPLCITPPSETPTARNHIYIYEPDSATVLDTLYAMLLRMFCSKILTESKLSEQASRIMAMQSSHDNALKLLDTLRLEYNKLRQQNITTELLDIMGGTVRDGI